MCGARLALAAMVAVGAVTLAAPASGQEPSLPQPASRTGVELLALDVTALDEGGHQIRDLTADEFEVRIDGRARPLVSAEYVRLVDPARSTMTAADRRLAGAAAAGSADTRFFSSNRAGTVPGRLVLLIVDQGNIRVGGGRRATDEARQFVDRLQPEDRIGVALIPAPGTLLDFTTDHDAVKETLLRALGTATPARGRFNLSASEARALSSNSRGRTATEVLMRECGGALPAVEAERCQRDVVQDASEMAAELHQQAAVSLQVIQRLLEVLGHIEGPKQVILLSEGLVLDDLGSSLDDLARAAADALASIDVLLLDVSDADAVRQVRPTNAREDRALQEEGLERLAALSRGAFHRLAGNTALGFDRVVHALEGYYLLSVEARPGDRDDRRHQVDVSTTRPGATLRTRPTALSAADAGAGTVEEAVSKALRSPVSSGGDLPMRLSTWSLKEPGTTRHRVLVTVEVDLTGDELEFITGLVVVDREGRGFVPEIVPRTLVPGSQPGRAAYATTLLVDPGSYRLRVAMADTEGRLGSVERPLDVFLVDGTAPAMSDLLLGRLPSSPEGTLRPAIEPRVSSQKLAALIEAYPPAGANRSAVAGTLEVLRSEESPAIYSAPLDHSPARFDDIAAMQAILDPATLPPGRYLARANLTFDGKPIGSSLRPFRIEARGGTTLEAASVPPAFTKWIVDSLSEFDSSPLFSTTMTEAALAQASGTGTITADAVAEARSGDFAGAAVTALLAGNQGLAAFLKGLDLLKQGQPERAAPQLQSAMSLTPGLVLARAYLGATFAAAGRHSDAAGLFQSGATPETSELLRLLAGEEWLRAGEFDRAIDPLADVAAESEADARVRRVLGLAYVLANQPAEGLPVLRTYLARHPDDAAAALAGIYALYARHQGGAKPSLATDRELAQRWLEAYGAGGGDLPLATAWVTYLAALK